MARKNFWVQGGLLEEGSDDCDLEGRWNNTSLKGEFDSLGDQGAENGDV